MKTIHVASKFILNLGHRVESIFPGVHVVDDEIADHWYTKAHLSNNGIGSVDYATTARGAADTAYVRAKEAVALYVAAEKTVVDAEEMAKVERTEPAYMRLGPMPGPSELEREPDAPAPVVAEVLPTGALTVDFDAMSDDELRVFIKDRDGRSPHPATSRGKLLDAARGDEEAAQEIEREEPETPPETPPAA